MPQAKGRRAPSSDLHGNAPDSCPVALLLVDVINEFAFGGGDKLARRALPAARSIASLRLRARRAHVPCIFANDNFGRWRSDENESRRICGLTPMRSANACCGAVALLR